MLTGLIIEDNFRDGELLAMFLNKYCSRDLIIVGNVQNIESAYQLILEKKPDVIFLDVELGTESGFDLLAKFTEYPFRVIFVTAFDQYAIKAIKFNALDYLLKPLDLTELVHTVQKTVQLSRVSVDPELKNLIHTLAHPFHKTNKVAIPVLQGYQLVTVETILYCEARKEYTDIHFTNQPPICSSVNLGEYEELLHDYSFCRVHHSFLVNKDHVQQYLKGEGGELLLERNIRIPVSRRKKQEVMDWLRNKSYLNSL